MKFLAGLILSLSTFAAEPTTAIKLNQAGYLPNAPKIAVVVSETATGEFSIRPAAGGAAVFTGKLSAPVKDEDSGDLVRTADFTKLERAGQYYLEAAGAGRGWTFTIGKNVYDRAYYLAMRSYYGQRCGTAVDLGAEFPGYKYAACHLEGAYHASSGREGSKPPSGGWHDAGDYGRYVVNSGITTATLLWTWELYGNRIRNIGLKIPESGNGTPDILSEIRWNLDWMLTMQDDDGGAWHKQTSERFCAFVSPEKDTLPSLVIGTGAAPFKSTCATGDLAAVAAIAARVFKPFDPAYAEKCLRAARKAWAWIEQNPSVLFRNPAGVSTGAYGDGNCADEHLWAAAELYRTTREESFQRYFLANYAAMLPKAGTPPSWGMLAPMALWTYALAGEKDEAGSAIRAATVKGADEIVERARHNGYRTSMTSRDYIWGSNAVVANYGMLLLIANAMQPDKRYTEAAIDNLHYLLGRNTFSLSFVTRLGDNATRHPHHRPTGAQGGEPWPGLLAGGPNHAKQDPAMRKLPDLPPAKMYLDEQASYATNEVAINWNAPLVFMLSGVM